MRVDLPELDAFPTLGRPDRVVWAEEATVRARRVGGRREERTEEARWIWVTDLPAAVVPAVKIQRWGHARWDIENRSFNELATLWHMDHCFVQDVVALEALLLTLALAFLLTYAFHARNLKPAARRALSRLALADQLREDFARPASATVWPEGSGPGWTPPHPSSPKLSGAPRSTRRSLRRRLVSPEMLAVTLLGTARLRCLP